MLDRIRTVMRRNLAAALATALFAGSATMPTAAPAASTAELSGAAKTCSTDYSTHYTYYLYPNLTGVVGHGIEHCDGTYEHLDGYKTNYYRFRTLDCPY